MGQPVPQRKFSENVIELFDVRDVYQDIKNFFQQQRDRFTGKYNPGTMSPTTSTLSRANSARHPRVRDRVNMDVTYDGSTADIESERLLAHAAIPIGDDQFDVVAARGDADAIVIDSVSSDGGLLPLHAEKARSHDAS